MVSYFSGLGHIAFNCCHIEQTVDFYKQLGFRLLGTLWAEDRSWSISYVELRRGQVLELIPFGFSVPPHGVSYQNLYLAASVPEGQFTDPEGNAIRVLLPVTDMDSGMVGVRFCCTRYEETVRFYRDVMELPVLQEGTETTCLRAGERDFIELVNVEGRMLDASDAGSFRHYCIQTEDIAAAAKMLAKKDVELLDGGERFLQDDSEKLREELDKVDLCGSLAMGVLDPEGNWVEIMQYTDKSIQLLW